MSENTPDAGGDTPATSQDNALGSEGDTDQLPSEDTLVERGVPDLLDEGYSPPDRDRSNHWGETAYEEAVGEPQAQRLAEEVPEVWESDAVASPERQPDRAGRLEQTTDAGRGTDVYADDAGVAGGAASAEEAAMHVLEED